MAISTVVLAAVAFAISIELPVSPAAIARGLSPVAISATASVEGTVEGASEPTRTASTDPATWSNAQLANQLVLAGVTMASLQQATAWVRVGIGGVVLFGSAPGSLATKLRALRATATAHPILVASDEEGGAVQRLASLVGRLPSARTIGRTKTPAQTKALAYSLGRKMKRLGVNLDLAPVADLAVPGAFISNDGRAFSPVPETAAKYVTAFSAGLTQAGVMSGAKHWPGHGGSADTHVGTGSTQPWSVLSGRDAVPFNAAFAAGIPSVMVGHLRVPGLTEPGLPASLSPTALATLRKAAGPNTVIMTDSLSMGAVTSAMHQTGSQAAVRSLIAGADMALVQAADPLAVARAIQRAISNGRLPRPQAVASARRVLAAQLAWS